MAEKQGVAAQRYNQLEQYRQPFLDRARDCALYTIPSLIPPEGHSGSTKYSTPYQSLGARGVNNLASKLLLALLPPSSTFFRLFPSEKVLAELQPEDKAPLQLALSQVEQTILREVESRGVRIHAFEAFKHLIVGGNVLLHLSSKGVRVFPLNQYVVKRDPEGAVLEIVVKEVVSPMTLPEDIRETVTRDLKPDEKTVELFTYVKREQGGWTVFQEAKGVVLPESHGTYPLDKCPWVPLRWTRIDGEDYGRGLCEEYLGDLISLEGLSKAIVEWAAIASKVVFLCKPGSLTRPRELEKTPNGGFADGDKEDVGVLQVEKFADFQVVRSTAEEISSRLSYAFLLNSAVRRNGERVTAEEIRYMASELEDTLGGVYSVMSLEFQLPLVRLVMSQLEKAGRLPILPKDTVTPTIVTGIDALGRSHELMRLDAWLGGALQQFGPEVLRRVRVDNYLTRRAAGLGIDVDGLVRTEEEIQQENMAAQQMALAEKVGPSIVSAANEQYMAATGMNQQVQPASVPSQPQ